MDVIKTSPRVRHRLAGSVRGIVPKLSPGRLPGASPLNRVALRPCCAELLAIADRLDDLERPVSAVGVRMVHRLLTEPGSALYARDCVDPRLELRTVLRSLELHR
jgi:hypothetical protein